MCVCVGVGVCARVCVWSASLTRDVLIPMLSAAWKARVRLRLYRKTNIGEDVWMLSTEIQSYVLHHHRQRRRYYHFTTTALSFIPQAIEGPSLDYALIIILILVSPRLYIQLYSDITINRSSIVGEGEKVHFL